MRALAIFLIVVTLAINCLELNWVYAFDEKEWKQLNNQMMVLYLQKKYQEAIPLGETALRQAEEQFGLQDQKTTRTLMWLMQLYQAAGEADRAKELQNRLMSAMIQQYPKPLIPTGQNPVPQQSIAEQPGDFGKEDARKSMRALADQYRAVGAQKDGLNRLAEGGVESKKSVTPAEGSGKKGSPPLSGELLQSEPDQPYQKIGKIQKSLEDIRQLKAQMKGADRKNVDLDVLRKSMDMLKNIDPDSHGEMQKGLSQLKPLIEKGMGGGDAKPEELLSQLQKMTGTLGKTNPEFAGAMEQFKDMMPDSQVESLVLKGRYRDALRLAETDLAESEKKLGAGHPGMLLRRNKLSFLYARLAMFDKAEPAIRQEAETASKVLEQMNHGRKGGSNDAKRPKSREKSADLFSDMTKVGTLSRLGDLYMQMARYEEAERFYRQAVDVYAEAVGEDNLLTTMEMVKIGDVLRMTGAYSEAQRPYRQALEGFEKYRTGNESSEARLKKAGRALDAIGIDIKPESLMRHDSATYGARDSLPRAVFLDKQAELYRLLGKYHDAKKALEEALAIWVKAKLPHDQQEIRILHHLADISEALGEYKEAETRYQAAHEIAGKINEQSHADMVFTHLDLGRFYEKQGAYASARERFQTGLTIQEQSLGEDHPEMVDTLASLARLHDREGNFSESKAFLDRALKIARLLEQRTGGRHPTAAVALTNLAEFYSRHRQFGQAVSLYEEALAIRRHVFKPLHLDIAASLTGLAGAYEDTGAYDKAKPLHEEALDIRRKVLGADHPDAATTMLRLASLHRRQGSYSVAAPLVMEALAACRRSIPENHPLVAASLVEAARLAIVQDDAGKGLEYLRQAVRIENTVLHGQLGVAREERKVELIEKMNETRDLVIALVDKHFRHDEQAVRFAFELVLARKGVAFDDQARFFEALTSGLPPHMKSEYERLKQKNTVLQMHPPPELAPETLKNELDQNEAALEAHEAKMAAQSQSFGKSRLQRQASAEQLAKILPPDSVLVEFLKVPSLDLTDFRTRGEDRYLAWVLRPDRSIALVEVGRATAIDSAIDKFQSSVQRSRTYARIDRGARAPQRRDTGSSLENAEQLYKAIWTPIQSAIKKASVTIISPDGQLNLVPFAALRNAGEKKFLVEDAEIVYVTSGRDLIGEHEAQTLQGELIMVANPNFGGVAKGNPSVEISNRADATRSGDVPGTFEPLPGTQKEAERIPSLLDGKSKGKKVLTQEDAQEAAVLAVRRPLVLHMATHGFFLSDTTPRPAEKDQPAGWHPGSGAVRRTENSLLRSGLALTGANQAGKASSAIDGLLTAYEVSGMDLHGTELVVLSACQTGVGEVRNGEGVFGLRRAFALAGAKNLVMSLWNVDDELTVKQMEGFYRSYVQGRHPAAALRAAQLAMIEDMKKAQGIVEPFYWAPFFVQGQTSIVKAAR